MPKIDEVRAKNAKELIEFVINGWLYILYRKSGKSIAGCELTPKASIL